MHKLFLIVFSLLVLPLFLQAQTYNPYSCNCIFCNVSKHYNHVKSQDEENLIPAYQFFLEKHKRSKLFKQANNELLKLKEDRDWNIAKSINTIKSYQVFISTYPNSQINQSGYAAGSLERIMMIEIILSWYKADSINTLSSYQEFISNFPGTDICWLCHCHDCKSSSGFSYVDTALVRISIIQDNNAWDIARNESTLSSYRNYLDKYPNGKNKKKAIREIEKIEIEPIWILVKKKKSIIEINDFIKKYPSSFYAKLAQEELAKIELSYWEKAKSRHRRTYYKRYIENFPQGEYITEALENLMNLEIAYEESKNNIKSAYLPDLSFPLFDPSVSNNKHRFSISNATKDLGLKRPHTVLVSYRGNTVATGYVEGSYTIKADKCVFVDLLPGTYFFVIESKTDKSVTKYRNKVAYDFSLGQFHSDFGYLYVARTYMGVSLPESPSEEVLEMMARKYEDCSPIK